MDLLKYVFPATFGLVVLVGCERDFSSQWLPTPSDSGSVVASKPQSPAKKDQKDTAAPVKTKPQPAIPIESLSASDLRLTVGDTKPAAVTVLPANATSPLYELTSNKPDVATVAADGIHGAGEGSATITVHALDGSDKVTHFHVIVDAVFDTCVLLPCLCLGKIAGKGDGKGKDKGDGGDNSCSVPIN